MSGNTWSTLNDLGLRGGHSGSMYSPHIQQWLSSSLTCATNSRHLWPVRPGLRGMGYIPTIYYHHKQPRYISRPPLCQYYPAPICCVR